MQDVAKFKMIKILDLPMEIKFILIADLTITHETVNLEKQKEINMSSRVMIITLLPKNIQMVIVEVIGSINTKNKTWLTISHKIKTL
jgi:hypothetical protein